MFLYLITFFTIIIDFITKKIALFHLNKDIPIFWEYLKLKLVYNKWIAFSIPLEWIILKIITLLAIILISYYYYKFEKNKKSRLLDLWYALIIGWAISNGFDRFVCWSVIDFISVKYFAIFNFADIFINVWVVIILFYYLKLSWKNKK